MQNKGMLSKDIIFPKDWLNNPKLKDPGNWIEEISKYHNIDYEKKQEIKRRMDEWFKEIERKSKELQ